jgi:hypothetical protein
VKIYDEATAEFKARAGQDEFIRFMERTRMKMGTCDMAATVSGKYVSVGEHGQFATISSRRRCENGELQESFTWLASGGKLLLNGYQANSPLLLTD